MAGDEQENMNVLRSCVTVQIWRGMGALETGKARLLSVER